MSRQPDDRDEDHGEICPRCDGSGEGMTDGSTCKLCGGSGDHTHPRRRKAKLKELEPEDFFFREDE